jgi:hypothetical protein
MATNRPLGRVIRPSGREDMSIFGQQHYCSSFSLLTWGVESV